MTEVQLDEALFEGAVSFERGHDWIKPWRLPFPKLRLFPPDDALVPRAETAAGVRLRFRTNAETLVVALVPADQPRLFDLTIDGDLLMTVCAEAGNNQVLFPFVPEGDKIVELWLPQGHPVAMRHLLIEDQAECSAIEDTRPRWIAYGSSITHCGAAHSPARTWPATVARERELNLTCLGYGGNCHLEPMVAMMIRDMPADFISLKVGINVLGGMSLSGRTFAPAVIGFVQIIREKHPHVPIAVISPIISPPREEACNAVGLSLTRMRAQIQDAVRRMIDCGDAKLHYFSGLDLFGEDLVHDYLPDEVHPNGDGYEILGHNFSKLVFDKIALPRV
jgi:hypothetical protein